MNRKNIALWLAIGIVLLFALSVELYTLQKSNVQERKPSSIVSTPANVSDSLSRWTEAEIRAAWIRLCIEDGKMAGVVAGVESMQNVAQRDVGETARVSLSFEDADAQARYQKALPIVRAYFKLVESEDGE